MISIILNFLLASGLAGTLVFFNSKRRRERAAADSAELENTEKVVAIQSEQITRLDSRVEKLEEKVDKLEIIIEHKDVAVSYTHLDVYKRQMQERARKAYYEKFRAYFGQEEE